MTDLQEEVVKKEQVKVCIEELRKLEMELVEEVPIVELGLLQCNNNAWFIKPINAKRSLLEDRVSPQIAQTRQVLVLEVTFRSKILSTNKTINILTTVNTHPKLLLIIRLTFIETCNKEMAVIIEEVRLLKLLLHLRLEPKMATKSNFTNIKTTVLLNNLLQKHLPQLQRKEKDK